jgi:hypothetical protein
MYVLCDFDLIFALGFEMPRFDGLTRLFEALSRSVVFNAIFSFLSRR